MFHLLYSTGIHEFRRQKDYHLAIFCYWPGRLLRTRHQGNREGLPLPLPRRVGAIPRGCPPDWHIALFASILLIRGNAIMENIEQRIARVRDDREHGSRWLVGEAIALLADLASDTT